MGFPFSSPVWFDPIEVDRELSSSQIRSVCHLDIDGVVIRHLSNEVLAAPGFYKLPIINLLFPLNHERAVEQAQVPLAPLRVLSLDVISMSVCLSEGKAVLLCQLLHPIDMWFHFNRPLLSIKYFILPLRIKVRILGSRGEDKRVGGSFCTSSVSSVGTKLERWQKSRPICDVVINEGF